MAMKFEADKPTILLISKQDFSTPRDGGTMRSHAVHNEMLKRGLGVRTLCVEAELERIGVRTSRSHLNNLLPKLRVLLSYAHIGSISSARWFRPTMVDRIMNELSGGAIDCVVIEYTQLMGYATLFKVPVVLDMHNIESELLENYAKSSTSLWRRILASYEAKQLRKLERSLPAKVQVLSTVSDHDADIATGWSQWAAEPVAKIVLAANGVSDPGFSIELSRRPDVVFVAHLGWQPNIDAAKWLVNDVWPLVVEQEANLKLRLIGRAPSDEVRSLAGTGISVHGDVDSVVEHVASARVATAPLLAAGGTRLKILEALSCGTPVVATSLGALGLEGLAGPSLIIADSAQDFADQIVRLSRSEADRSGARELVEAFRWPTTLRQLGEEVESVAMATYISKKQNVALVDSLSGRAVGTVRSK